MAYIEGGTDSSSGRSVFGQFGFTLFAGGLVTALMLFFSENRTRDLFTVLAIFSVITFVVLLVQYKLNPAGWLKVFNRKKFENYNRQNNIVISILQNLDDSYFILSNFSFEFFHVDHIVISKNGVFVIDKIREDGELNVEDGILYSGERSLESLTGRVWKISHLINKITGKSFPGGEIMPKPVLVLPDRRVSEISEFNGIRIAGADELLDVIAGELRFMVDEGGAESFAHFAKERYIRH